MKTLIITLFILFASCKDKTPYRAIEISIINAEQGTISLFKMPEKTMIRNQYFDINYQNIIYLHNIPNGEYYLQVISDMELRDTSFVYTGVIGLGVEF